MFDLLLSGFGTFMTFSLIKPHNNNKGKDVLQHPLIQYNLLKVKLREQLKLYTHVIVVE